MTRFSPTAVMAAMLVLVIGAVVPAHADFIVDSGDIYDWLISDPVEVGEGDSKEDLLSFTLSVVNKTGNADFDPRAFESGGDSGLTGIGGMLHQQVSIGLGAAQTPTLDAVLVATPIDSHFLFRSSDVLALVAPTETVGSKDSSETSDVVPESLRGLVDTNFGSHLAMTGTLQMGVNPGAKWDLAYLVVPRNSQVTVNARVSGREEASLQSADFSFAVPVPEPGTASVLLLGMLSMAARRKVI